MKHVGVREFRDHATKYFAGDEVVAIERHGETIGYYMPAKHEPTKSLKVSKAEAWDRLEESIQRILDQTGLTREEFERWFDLSQPIPEDLIAKLQNRQLVDSSATGS